MKLGELLRKFHLERVRLRLPAMQLEMSFEETDKDAAWNLYIELLTRITTQPLASESGDEAAALESVYAVVGATRQILRGARPELDSVQQGGRARPESGHSSIHEQVAQKELGRGRSRTRKSAESSGRSCRHCRSTCATTIACLPRFPAWKT